MQFYQFKWHIVFIFKYPELENCCCLESIDFQTIDHIKISILEMCYDEMEKHHFFHL